MFCLIFVECGNGKGPKRDSEGEIFWCDSHSVRSCPSGSSCVTDAGGYQICCDDDSTETSTSQAPLSVSTAGIGSFTCK